MSENREFDNTFRDYAGDRGSDVVHSDGRIRSDFQIKLQNSGQALMNKLEKSLDKKSDPTNYSVYTGTTGIALMYYFVRERLHHQSYLQTADELVSRSLSLLNARKFSFLNGDAGPLALGAVLSQRNGNPYQSSELIKRLKSLLSDVLDTKSDLPDEVLYGRAGYLHALLFVNKHIGQEVIEESVIRSVIVAILKSGKSLAKQERRTTTPLMYMWHDKHYLGAAHGMSGILFMLLQARKYLTSDELNTLIKPSVDYLMGVQFKSGNFPSSLESKTDRLVQWCHGAPGMVQLFGLAHEVYGDKKYLTAAEDCGEVVWKRGLLRKGYGICHGVAGNAYTFLHLYQITKDVKNLHRAMKFAEFCTDYGKHNLCRTPDRPLSLFEGLAGTIYILIDIQDPLSAKFPAYEL